MIELNRSVRLIILQFSFSNPDLVPTILKEQELDTLESRNERKSRKGSGKMVISPTENSSLSGLLDDLKISGYELVDAFYQPRTHPKNPHITYHMVRFVFARNEYVNISDEFKKMRGKICDELQGLCEKTMWRVRAFLNPYSVDNRKDSEYHVLSINLEARKPLFLPDGQPVMMWEKNENGKRLGDAPKPIMANHKLQITDNIVRLAGIGRPTT